MDELSFEERLDLIRSRHSIRSFADKQVDPSLLRELVADITMVNSHESGFHFSIVTDDPAPFGRFDSSYGVFRNVRNYLACIIDTSFPDIYERAGYYAEEFVLKCVAKGLGSCFVGGAFEAAKVGLQMRADWKLPFVVVFGYPFEKERPLVRMMSGILHRKKMCPEDFFEGDETDLRDAVAGYPKLPVMLSALERSPSLMNRRPVRLRVNDDYGGGRLEAYVSDGKSTSLIDLGIAKCNMAFASGMEWEWGNGASLLLE